jgi:hypothetical protein
MSIARANCRFEFKKRGQLFVRSHNETLSVAVMRAWGWNPRTSLERAVAVPRVRFAVDSLLLGLRPPRSALRIEKECRVYSPS